MALCQLRALLYLAQRLLNNNKHGQLHSLEDEDLSRRFVNEYTSMHKACFYGRCLGFQVRSFGPVCARSVHSCMFVNALCNGSRDTRT